MNAELVDAILDDETAATLAAQGLFPEDFLLAARETGLLDDWLNPGDLSDAELKGRVSEIIKHAFARLSGAREA
jgi:hypothetical protein